MLKDEELSPWLNSNSISSGDVFYSSNLHSSYLGKTVFKFGEDFFFVFTLIPQ